MSNLDDIFDLPEGAKQYMEEPVETEPVKKPRKKAEMSDDKKAAMLERLKLGRTKRQENLKAKKGIIDNDKSLEIKPEVKKEENKESLKVEHKKAEDERLSFINMMAGKSKPSKDEKFERPKKKVYSEPKEIKAEPKKEEVKEVQKPIVSVPIAAPTTVTKQPVIIRTFKKPIWA